MITVWASMAGGVAGGVGAYLALVAPVVARSGVPQAVELWTLLTGLLLAAGYGWMIGSFLAAPAVLLIGWPTLYLLRRLGLRGPLRYAAVGLVAGAVLAIALALTVGLGGPELVTVIGACSIGAAASAFVLESMAPRNKSQGDGGSNES